MAVFIFKYWTDFTFTSGFYLRQFAIVGLFKIMYSLIKGRSGACALLLLLLVVTTAGQQVGEECLAQFEKGRDDFVLDADGSVKDGATFISSPKLYRHKDCVQACCKDSRCNVAFMEEGEEGGTISSCFLFDCLYKQKYVCHFVGKKGYDSYIHKNIFSRYHVNHPDPGKAKTHKRIFVIVLLVMPLWISDMHTDYNCGNIQ